MGCSPSGMRLAVAEFNPVYFLIGLVTGNDHLLAWFETIHHLDVVGVAPPEPHIATQGPSAIGCDHEHPVAAGVLVERAVWNHHGARGSSELYFQIDGFPDVDPRGWGVIEVEVCLECTATDLGVGLGDVG